MSVHRWKVKGGIEKETDYGYVVVHATVPDELKTRIVARARKDGNSISETVRQLLIQALKENTDA